MSNELDFLDNIFHLSSNEKKALENAAAIINGVSSMSGVGTTLKTVLAELGLLPSSNLVQEVRDALNQIWRRFEATLSALGRIGLSPSLASFSWRTS